MRLRRDVQAKVPRAAPAPKREGLEPGAVVRVESYGAEGPIVELKGDDVTVQLGLLKVTVPKGEVKPARAAKPKPKVSGVAAPSRFEKELNVRGERVEEAIEHIRDFIVEAHAIKASPVRIVHGKGTGALRDAVRGYLKNERLVERFEDAVPYEGGHGVTVAYLRL